MKCRQVKQLAYLSGEGEMPEEIRRQVLQHAGSCRRCAQELKQVGSTAQFIADLRGVDPQLDAQRDLAEQIMRGVELVRNGGALWRRKPFFVPFRRLQVACTVAAAALTTIFFVQNTVDYYRITELESRLNQSTAALVASSEETSLSVVGLSAMAEVDRFLVQSPPATTGGLQERLRLREAVRSFCDMLAQGPPGFVSEVQRLRLKYPGLWIISPLNGVTSRDRSVMSRQRESLMKDIRQLLQTGKTDHDK
jgi:hypothetical protein